jgi:Ca2+-binding RTX toxin-like protein
MAYVRLRSGFDMLETDYSQFTDGSLSFNSTVITITGANYVAQLTGEGFGFDFLSGTVTGTVRTFTVSVEGQTLFDVTRLNIPANDVYQNLDDSQALIDLVFGGKDKIYGSDNADVLAGFGGSDILDGNKGADTLFGGEGRDTFVYNKVSDSNFNNPDLIADLSNRDTINLKPLGVTADDVQATFDAGTGMTTFSINTDDDAAFEMRILALGDHTDFTGFNFAV